MSWPLRIAALSKGVGGILFLLIAFATGAL